MSENIDTGKRDKKNTVVDIHSAFDVLYEAIALIFFSVKSTYLHTYITWPLPQLGFSGPMETNNANEHNMVKNPNWQEANQLAIYKRTR